MKIDWSNTSIGYYDLDLRRVGSTGSCCDWWEELFPNHEDRGIVQYQMVTYSSFIRIKIAN